MQMMFMGCGMIHVISLGIQQYMPLIRMGINKPVMPFPNMFLGSTLPTNFKPRFLVPHFHMLHVPTLDSFTMPIINLEDNNIPTSLGTRDSNQPCILKFTDLYQQYLGPRQMQFQLMQVFLSTNAIFYYELFK